MHCLNNVCHLLKGSIYIVIKHNNKMRNRCPHGMMMCRHASSDQNKLIQNAKQLPNKYAKVGPHVI